MVFCSLKPALRAFRGRAARYQRRACGRVPLSLALHSRDPYFESPERGTGPTWRGEAFFVVPTYTSRGTHSIALGPVDNYFPLHILERLIEEIGFEVWCESLGAKVNTVP